MTIETRTLFIYLAAAATLCIGTAHGDDYPVKPIRMVTPGPGGSADAAARLLAQGVSGPLGQQVLVDNRPSGVIPGQVVAQSAPDGYTILFTGGSLWILPLLQKTPYDPARDFAPVTLTHAVPQLLVVHPSLPVKSVSELIALARARPGELNYSSASSGTVSHLAGELFNSMARVRITRVSYASGSVRMASLINGEVQIEFSALSLVTPYVKSNRLRAIAVTSARRSSLAPGLPTVAAAGVPGYEAVTTHVVFVPAKTPPDIIRRLNREIVQFLNTQKSKELSLSAGMENIGSSPEELATTMRTDVARVAKLIKDAGITAE